MNISDSSGILEEQSANFQGNQVHSNAHLRSTVSLAALAASLARAAKSVFQIITFALCGFSSN